MKTLQKTACSERWISSARTNAALSFGLLVLTFVGCGGGGGGGGSGSSASPVFVPTSSASASSVATSSVGSSTSSASSATSSVASSAASSVVSSAASSSAVTISGTALLSLTANTTISLDTCGGQIASNVPSFYKNLFMCSNISLSADEQSVVFSFYGLPSYTSPYYPSTHPNYVAYNTDQAAVTKCTAGQQAGQASGCYTKNPNTLAQKTLTVTIPLNPVAKGISVNSLSSQVNNTSGDANDYNAAVVGVSVNGLPLFSGFAAPGDNINDEAYTFDSRQGHPTGASFYHYHRYSKGALEVLVKKGLNTSTTPGSPSSGGVELYGITCDGVIVMGSTEFDGTTPDVATYPLDVQSGHVHAIKDKAGVTHFTSRYHVHISPTSTYKFVPELQYYNTCTSTGG